MIDHDPGSPPPPVRRPLQRPIALIAGGVVLATLLLVVVLSHEPPAPLATGPKRDVTELIDPMPLASSDGEQSGEALIGQLGAGAGWIDTVDPETGEPAQRYRMQRLHPNPDGLGEGWFRMEQPEAQLQLSDDRVLFITGRSALVRAPEQTLESGTISGDVEIRLHRAEPGRPFTAAPGEPLLRLRTEEAAFDNELGTVDCALRVHVEAEQGEMVGTGVSLAINDVDDRVQLLIEQPLYFAVDSTGDDLFGGAPAEQAAAADDADAGARAEVELDRAESDPRERRAEGGRGERFEQRAARRRAARRDGGDRPQRRASAGTQPGGADRAGEHAAEAAFYLLTFTDDVVVRAGEAEARRTVRGDALEIVFHPESGELDAFASATMLPRLHAPGGEQAPGPAFAPLALTALLPRLAQGSLDEPPAGEAIPEPTAERTIITCRGPVTMVPLPATHEAPAHEEDVHLALTGSPVHVEDTGAAAEATCGILRYQTAAQTAELLATAGAPLVIAAPQLEASGTRFWLDRAAGRGGFTGAGELLLRDEGAADGAAAAPLKIDWARAMELDYRDDGAGRTERLRSAAFDGDVRVRGEGVDMDAATMTVHFDDGAQGAQQVRSVLAAAARLRDQEGGGSIAAPQLELELRPGEGGTAQPHRMLAHGGIEAVDLDRTVWAERLEATFRDGEAAGEAGDAPEAAPTGAGGLLGGRGGTALDELVAEGSVQILTADGSRAFADRLEMDGETGTGALIGDDLLVIDQRLALEGGTRLELDRDRGLVTWPGPGHARAFEQPVLDPVVGPRRPIERPVIGAGPVQMDATWVSRMTWDTVINDGAGAIDLHGDVDVTIQRTELEHNTIEGQHLTVEFDRAGGATVVDGSEPTSLANRESRTIARFIARHGARLESRTWERDQAEARADVFYVAGEHVQWDERRGEALVIGDGTLLVRDETTDEPGTAEAGGTAAAPFSGRGTALFLFKERLHMETIGPGLYRVMITGDVQAMHKDLEGRTASMTATRLEVILAERDAAPAVSSAGAEPGPGPGGALELRRIQAFGGVYVRSDDRQVECDELDYDLETGIAVLAAAPGRSVSVSGDDGEHLNAAHVEWDMGRDVVKARRPGGRSTR